MTLIESIVWFPTEDEEARARACGLAHARRYASGEVRERAYVPGSDRESNNIIGSMGELLFSERHLGERWVCDLEKYGKPDVLGYHVRTYHRPWLEPALHVQPQDPDAGIFVMLWTTAPKGQVLGKYVLSRWTTGEECRRLGTLADPGGIGKPAHWIRRSLMHPIETLPETPELARARRIAKALAEGA
jgi:hypothetical protein